MTQHVSRPGRIALVGIGPGDPAHMTARARAAIAEAEVVIGYKTYLKLIPELLEDKQVIGMGMSEELERVEMAWEHARSGRRVALVSSGDAGVYGMAGPTYEWLLDQGWEPGEGAVGVEVVPGATALSSCSALVGAPLTHDFCAISLSDLLTPWPVIARRLEAAGRGDFVVVLYNPASKRRRAQLREAQRILLRYRAPETPVAVVRAAFRERQQVQQQTLGTLDEAELSMLSTVIIGSSATDRRAGVMVTPRGYTAKYGTDGGGPAAGEQRGRSLRLGLAGWPAELRHWLREQPGSSLAAAAQAFDVAWGEALAAVISTEVEPGTPFQSTPVAAAQIPEVLDACRAWPRLRAVVVGAGGCAAVEAGGESLEAGDQVLALRAAGAVVEVERHRLAEVWYLERADGTTSLELLDKHRRSLLSLEPFATGDH